MTKVKDMEFGWDRHVHIRVCQSDSGGGQSSSGWIRAGMQLFGSGGSRFYR